MSALGMNAFAGADEKHVPIAEIKVDDLNLETPLSSMNVTPEHVRNDEMSNINLYSISKIYLFIIISSDQRWRWSYYGSARNLCECCRQRNRNAEHDSRGHSEYGGIC